MKKTIALLLAAVMLFALTACNSGENDTDRDTDRVTGTAYPDKTLGFQTEMPKVGETVACMHTSMGDIYLRFFPEAAPKSVENFLTHAKNGYYDGVTFHRVIEDFMIQGGDPAGTGAGGESIWGSDFADEFDAKLLNIRGSLSMANSGSNTNGSQFFINQAGPTGKTAAELKTQYDYDTLYASYTNYYQQYVNYYGSSFTTYYPTADSFIENYIGGISPISYKVPDEAWELYAELGGNISLDGAFRNKGGHTVFGQVYQGMDVVDAIAAVETDDNDKPTTDVTITSIEVFTYAETQN